MKSIASRLLLSIGIAAILFSLFLLYHAYSLTDRRVTEVVEQQASMALKFDLAIRDYVARYIRPVMYEAFGEDEFVPETMSTSYVAKSIFETVRRDFPDYIIKFSSANPRNPSNRAGPEELEVIEYFNKNPRLQMWEGKIAIGGKEYMAKFSTRRTTVSCLRCHGDPSDAPASLVKRYGAEAGFHMRIGEVIGLDTIAIPINRIEQKLWVESMGAFIVTAFGLLLFLSAITLTIRFLITNRLSIIAQHFMNAAEQTNYSKIDPIEIGGRDEIHDLALSFNALSGKLRNFYLSLELQVKERTGELEETNTKLRREIEERIRAEFALRESEATLKSIFRVVPIGIGMISDGLFKQVNDGLCKMVGYSPGELIDQNENILRPRGTDTERNGDDVDEDIRDYGQGTRETRWKRKDGRVIDVLLSSTPINPDDLSAGITFTALDVTDRKRAEKQRLGYLHYLESMERIEKAIRQTTDLDQMLRDVFETVSSIFDSDRTWLIYPCNPDAPSWSVPIEQSRNEFPGVFSQGRDIPTTPEMAAQFAAALDSEVPLVFDPESDRALPDSARSYDTKSAIIMALHPKLGEPWLWGLSQCAYDRVWTEDEQRLFREIGRRMADALSSLLSLRDLRRSEERFRYLVENVNEVIFTTDVKGVITYVSPTAKSLTGYSPPELVGKPLMALGHEEDRPLLMERFLEVLSGDILSYEYRIQKNDGQVRWVYSSGKPIFDGRDICGVQGMLTDIDDKKRTEEEKRELQEKLARSRKMEALGLLAGGVAHDLNNVLSGIVSYPELLLMDLPEDSRLRKPIMTIQDSGQKAAAIVQDLLTLARRSVTNTEILNLNDIVLDYLKSPEHEKILELYPNIKIETYLDRNLLNNHGAPVHLKKAVMNLVLNAAEAQPGGGRIILSTENRYIDKPIKGYDHIDEGDFAVLRVEDNGTGIAPDDLERIFEPFYTKKVMGRSGTGLGMAIVWGTVQDHRGYINIESVEGKGTIFEVFFPATRERTAQKKDRLSIEDYLGRGEKILIVDDIKEQREIASGMLKRLGYSVTAVASGEEAVNYMKGHSADLLVLDMIMTPGIDGLETYRRILKIHPLQKAIIASGFSETDRVREAQQLGAGPYIKKPYLLEKIGLAVRSELDGGRKEAGSTTGSEAKGKRLS